MKKLIVVASLVLAFYVVAPEVQQYEKNELNNIPYSIICTQGPDGYNSCVIVYP